MKFRRIPQYGQSGFTLRRQLWLVVKHYWAMRRVVWLTKYYATYDEPKYPSALGRREFRVRFWYDIWCTLRNWCRYRPVRWKYPPASAAVFRPIVKELLDTHCETEKALDELMWHHMNGPCTSATGEHDPARDI